MLKRVLLLNAPAEIDSALERAAAERDLLLTPVQPGEPMPTAALACAGVPDPGALDALNAFGAREEAMLVLIARAVDVRESFVAGTTRRVYEHAVRFAQAMQLSIDERLAFEHAGYLHDVGKLRISNEVLLKKSLLTYDEWLTLQSHPKLGADLLCELGLWLECADIIRWHHECYDGTGYPDRLERDAIPRLARAMRLCDIYCAMTSPRVYRRNVNTHEQTIDFILSERGKHFDPELVDLFVESGIGIPMET